MSNIKRGSDFENLIVSKLRKKDYWVHKFANKIEGQPMDVIAIKKDKKFLFDCKVCSSDRFLLSRIEDNQEHASALFEKKAQGKSCFVIKMRNKIFVIDSKDIKKQKEIIRKKSFNYLELCEIGRFFEDVF